MGIRRGEEVLESLRDSRRVWVRGEMIDVVTNPRTAGFARSLAGLFELQHDPAYHDVLTMPSPRTGETVSRSYLEPLTPEDIVSRRLVTEVYCRNSGGMANRLPD